MRRILIVEDSPTMRALVTVALEGLSTAVKITEAVSGFEALRVLHGERFDLIVTDINMPDINGLCEEQRTLSFDSPGHHLDRELPARSREGSRPRRRSLSGQTLRA